VNNGFKGEAQGMDRSEALVIQDNHLTEKLLLAALRFS